LGDVQSDKIISLAISGNQRSPLAPEVPTFKEAGFDFNIGVYYRVMGPKGINPRVLEQLNQYFNEAISDKDLVEVITNKSGIVLQKMTPSEFGDYLTKDIELWKKVVSKKVS
jgi:tripartite-type tricarboxylate transporter receptor subunit TctC